MVEGIHEPRGSVLARARSLTGEIASQLLSLATSALGLVAALAWNDAIQSFFQTYFPAAGGIVAKFVYAVVVSVAIVLLTINLAKLARLARISGRNGTSRSV